MGKGSRDLVRPGLLLAGALVLLLCVLATASGQGVDWAVLEPDPPAVVEDEQPSEDIAGEGDGGRDEAGERDLSDDGGGLLMPGRAVATALVVALGLTLAAVVLRLRFSLRSRRPRQGRVALGALLEPVDPELLDDGDGLADALAEGLADLDAGTARNGIVAAWLRLEAAAESERFHRDPADTPAEFVAHVLASYDLDGDAIDRLAALYREARFSEHALGEAQRSEAAACLATLLRGLPAARRRSPR